MVVREGVHSDLVRLVVKARHPGGATAGAAYHPLHCYAGRKERGSSSRTQRSDQQVHHAGMAISPRRRPGDAIPGGAGPKRGAGPLEVVPNSRRLLAQQMEVEYIHRVEAPEGVLVDGKVPAPSGALSV